MSDGSREKVRVGSRVLKVDRLVLSLFGFRRAAIYLSQIIVLFVLLWSLERLQAAHNTAA